MPRFLSCLALAAAAAFSLWAPSVMADDAGAETPWQDHDGMVRTHLVAASAAMTDKDGNRLYAWEADMAPGWKTYWRSPGEAGLPVRLREGDKPIEILFPLPERFTLFGIGTTGYHNRVMLPFRMKKGTKPGTVISADFMVCKDICVPFEATYKLPETPDISGNDIRIGVWLKRVPVREGDAGVGLKVTGMRLMGTKGHQRLIVDVAADVTLSGADLFAEAGDMVHFGTPKMKLMADGKSARFVLSPMMGNKPFDLLGHDVRLTISDGHGQAIDRTLKITRP
ncbi:protein-disulfide reductase DsbD domain-containing protein [Kordiimonas marina]|uniref:protein-disulfide reductase DsbD domain-containing protein n=1 Tax=Kordiimonas marina TaxID=2872312 RepID=UPI001FF1235C|nr:protein-disulfide reductase DsbD domain-containing protein [Kordiimonas marina]MCJ9427631.1 hypothetical protein [Kordiimonas marina]